MADYQGEKFRAFISKMKENYKDYGFDKKPTNEILAEMIGVSSVQLNRYYKSKSLERETVSNITNTFKVEENEIWGDDLSKPNAKPARFLGDGTPNMWVVPIKAQGGFLEGYGDTVLMEHNIEKVYFPFIGQECFAFEIEGISMLPEYVTGEYFVGTPIENFNHLIKGRVYVFQTVEGIIIKEFVGIEDDFIHLRSLNEACNPVKPIYLKEVKRVYQREMVIKN
ncbi:S24 family peptidase [Sphingobacterium mizutaii]|uniref:S24 family peptidase n=1 Tax=Sphingobacterium mizutaii TaxID=1010 RepID=UPI0028A2580A|nr:S24 family peptidase [Sphingobacterium mizutaii]